MPKAFSPRSASPESLRRMRLKTGDFFLLAGMMRVASSASDGCFTFSHGDRRRLGALGLDRLFADLEAREAAHHDVLLDDRDLLLDQLPDRELAVLHEGLLEQARLGVVVLELALGDLV